MNFNPFPELHTERLLLRKIQISDASSILFLRSDETVNQYIQRKESDKTKTLDDAINFINKIDNGLAHNSFISWGICLKNQHNIIGSICLWNFSADRKEAELGYDLSPSFQRQGIMTEAMKKVVEYGFQELELAKIEAYTHKENDGSKRLLQKNQFILMPEKKDAHNEANLIFERIR